MTKAIEKEVYWIPEFSAAYGPSRSKIYEEFRSGRLKFFKIGRRTAISREAAKKWLALCESESGQQTKTKKVAGTR